MLPCYYFLVTTAKNSVRQWRQQAYDNADKVEFTPQTSKVTPNIVASLLTVAVLTSLPIHYSHRENESYGCMLCLNT
jgi:hypothetical protein